MRAIIVVPIEFPGSIFDEDDFILEDPNNVGNVFKVRPRANFESSLELKRGPLAIASKSKIPCGPFNNSLGRNLNRILRNKFEVSNFQETSFDSWTSRASTDFLEKPLATNISGVGLEAVESFTIAQFGAREEITHLLVFHLVANEKRANIDAIVSLTKLENAPIKNFLSHFYHTPFSSGASLKTAGKLPNKFDDRDEQAPPVVKWQLSNAVSSTFCILSSDQMDENSTVVNSNLVLRLEESDEEITRFATKAAFLASLVNIQKMEFEALEDYWISSPLHNADQVAAMRERLVQVRNNWWWPHISYDETVQSAYSQWVANCGFEVRLASFEKDISEWWSAYSVRRSAEEAEELARLNNLLKVIAIFGLVPAWLSLFATTFPWWGALIIAFSFGIGLWKIPARHLRRIIARFETKIK